MTTISEDNYRTLEGIAERYGVSGGAVEHLLNAVIAGGTTQAQFNHPELGGMGQWTHGGMIMVGDMFDTGLKTRISNLCSELAALAQTSDLRSSAGTHQSQRQGGTDDLSTWDSFSSAPWWPDDLGLAASSGAQNDMRYAFFPASRRLAIRAGEQLTVYDTRDHQIGGVSQQQGGDQSLTFTSQHGPVRISDLEIVSPAVPVADREPLADTKHAAATDTSSPTHAPASGDDIFAKIERLSELRTKGIVTDQEFETKKRELLDRL